MTIRVLKIATCPTLSGKSQLTYHVGCTSDSAVEFRIYASNGGGTFSQEWVAWQEIRVSGCWGGSADVVLSFPSGDHDD